MTFIKEFCYSELLFKIVLEALARTINKEKINKGFQIRKEKVKLTLFAYDIITYVESPQDYNNNNKKDKEKLLEVFNEFIKVAENKITTTNISYIFIH